MAVALFMMSYAKIYSDVDLLLPIGMSVLQVVQREEGDPQREGQEVVEEEPVAPPKKEAKKGRKAKRKSSGKKSGKQGTNNDAVSRNKHLDRGSVIELLETKAVKAAFGPGNKDEMEYSYPILISFLRNLTDEQWQVIYKGQKKTYDEGTACQIVQDNCNLHHTDHPADPAAGPGRRTGGDGLC
ncbi:uncharacterized protein LOC121557996 isoform X2 [Coregonus clupeaformis]|uniref:uncharacterized protein LOC121557996 isoform X2 n=1 Tax=Coregonus clupeaformis TaxID=59861 RepID=UPI001E1C568B|nr:uncharacterized protein LOC121557996 isoform X2 [Coregonus clupeaformis]XP_045067521.1 uncharacterized protein LOC121557996 isoform X2 [Coregonus clupeaformis]